MEVYDLITVVVKVGPEKPYDFPSRLVIHFTKIPTKDDLIKAVAIKSELNDPAQSCFSDLCFDKVLRVVNRFQDGEFLEGQYETEIGSISVFSVEKLFSP